MCIEKCENQEPAFKTKDRVLKARGIILNETDVGESDKIVTILLKEHGKITVSARGARKPKSKFLAGTQLFTYSDFVLFDGGKFTSIAQVDVIESFYNIRNDYEAFCYGAYFMEICHKFILENMPCDDVLQLLLKTLSVLAKQRLDKALVCAVFEFKFLQLNGFSPEADLSSELILSETARYAVAYILNSPLQSLFQFTVSDKVLQELKMAAETFLRNHLDLNLKSKKLLKDF